MLPYLKLAGVEKRYGGVVALGGANLECFRGEVHGLVGENGAGKSTLVRVLAGAVRAEAGEIWLDGRRIRLMSPADAISSGISTVFQELSLIPDMTVAQNIFFGGEPLAHLRTISRKDLYHMCDQLYKRLEGPFPDPYKEVRSLTLGDRQMVEIAKAVSRNPALLILDEATSALDRRQTDWLTGFCARFVGEGRAAIFISHHLAEVQTVADRITVFRNGRDVGVRQQEDATTDELVGLMLGRQVASIRPRQRTPAIRKPMLEVKDLEVEGRVHQVSFQLLSGEILGIGGLAGQGQDALFRALFGIETVKSGQILLSGRAIRIRNPRDAISQFGIALVPEDRATQGLFLGKSTVENITLSLLSSRHDLAVISNERERSIADELVRSLGIKVDRMDAPVRRLSGGNQQKVLLGKVLAAKPAVLLMFDSTRGVDVGTKAEIYQIVRELSDAGMAILLYSTESDELLGLSDRILVIRQGRLEEELRAAEMTEENLIRASLGESLIRSAPISASHISSDHYRN